MKKQLVLIASLTCGMVSFGHTEEVNFVGWIEHVRIQPVGITLKAKIDTGADNSSVHAENIELYEKDGTRFVKFVVANKQGESKQLDLPLVRMANIKRKGAEPLKRPVVSLNLCLGSKIRTVNVNLANRENFKYRMLIGRSYLKDLYLVSSSKQYTVEPACNSGDLAMESDS